MVVAMPLVPQRSTATVSEPGGRTVVAVGIAVGVGVAVGGIVVRHSS
jgi:hypothetical protein